MLALNRSLLNREYILMNVLKALASIISMCNLHVILLSKIVLVACYLYCDVSVVRQRTLSSQIVEEVFARVPIYV
jgi:hypothetical protein